MRRWATTGVVTATVLAAALVASSAGGTSNDQTLRLFEHDTTQANIDLGDRGESAGDQYVFAGDVFDRKGGTKLGRAGGTCTTVSTGATGEVLCAVNLTLPGGQIAG